MYFFSAEVSGQSFKINLSRSHEQKLNQLKSGHKRMMKYYKYYKKDSAGHIKKLNKKARHSMDSAVKAEASSKQLNNFNNNIVNVSISNK